MATLTSALGIHNFTFMFTHVPDTYGLDTFENTHHLLIQSDHLLSLWENTFENLWMSIVDGLRWNLTKLL